MNEKEEALREYRKSVRDHIKGNIPFHEDGWGKQKEEPKPVEVETNDFFPKNWEGMSFLMDNI
jgi:hypothetical protein